MDNRLKLHEKLVEVLGSRFVYFQKPESIKMSYPCILYTLSNIDLKYANNKIYADKRCYQVTVVDYDPDSEIPAKMLSLLSMCRFNRFYVADNLNHWVYTLYF